MILVLNKVFLLFVLIVLQFFVFGHSFIETDSMNGNITYHPNSLIDARVKCNTPGVLQDMISTTVTRRPYNVTVLTEQQHRD